MPDVGVLQLTIRDNSEQAAGAVGTLATKLKNLQQYAGNLNLSHVTSQLQELVRVVAATKETSSAVKSLGTLFNALSNFGKLKGLNLYADQFTQLKAAIGDGFKIGQAGTQLKNMREAMVGDWGEKEAVSAIGDVAEAAVKLTSANASKVFSDTAVSLKEFAAGIRERTAALAEARSMAGSTVEGGMENSGDMAGAGFAKGIYNSKDEAIQAARDLALQAYEAACSALEIHSPSLKFAYIGMMAVKGMYNSIKTGQNEVSDICVQMVKEAWAQAKQQYEDGARLGDLKINDKGLGERLGSALKGGVGKAFASLREKLNDEDSFAGKVKEKVHHAFSEAMASVGDFGGRMKLGIKGMFKKGELIDKGEKDEIAGQFEEEIEESVNNAVETVNSKSGLFSKLKIGFGGKGKKAEESQPFQVPDDVDDFIMTASTVADVTEKVAESAEEANGNWDGLADEMREAEAAAEALKEETLESGQFDVEGYQPEGGQFAEGDLEAAKELADEYEQRLKDMSEEITRFKAEIAEKQENGLLSEDELLEAQNELKQLEDQYNDVKQQLDEHKIEWNLGEFSKVSSDVQECAEAAGQFAENMEDVQTAAENVRKAFDGIKPQQHYEAFPKETFEDYYYGFRNSRAEDGSVMKTLHQNDLTAQALQGNGSKNEETLAFSRMAREFGISVDEVKAKVEELRTAGMDAQQYMQSIAQQVEQSAGETSNAISEMVPEGNSFEPVVSETQEEITAAGELGEATQEAAEGVRDLGDASSESGHRMHSLKDVVKNICPRLANLAKQFHNIAKRMAMRAIIRQFASGVSEGVENVYQYSKAVGSDFAPAMDSAAAALQKMKNSIGAALAPAIQAVIPIINQLVSAVIDVLNYVNQFIALLTGQSTWTRALDTTAQAYDDVANSARGASKAQKDLLAGFDELNIIQSQSGGGSGGSGKTPEDYASMFEEVDTFDEGVVGVVNYLTDHFEDLKLAAELIGVAILGWKLSDAFSGAITKLEGIGAALAITGIVLSIDAGSEIGRSGGWDDDTLREAIGGVLATSVGGAFIGYSVGGAFGAAAGFVVGAAVAIAATVVSYHIANKERLENISWGTGSYTPEEVRDWVDSQFDFPVFAEIEIMETNIANRLSAKKDLEDKTNAFITSLTIAKLKTSLEIDGSEEAIKEAYESAKAAITSLETYMKTQEETLAVSLSVNPLTNNEGEDVSEDLLSSIMVADTTLRNYFTDLGRQMSEAMLAGERSGWAAGETQAALDLMESQRRIMEKATEYTAAYNVEFELKQTFDFDVADKAASAEALKRQEEIFDTYYEQFLKDRQTAAEGQLTLAGIASAALEEELAKQERGEYVDPEVIKGLEGARDAYLAAAEELMDPDKIKEQYEEKFAPIMAAFKEMWAEKLGNPMDSELSEMFSKLFPWLDTGASRQTVDQMIDNFQTVMQNTFQHRLDTDELTMGVVGRYGITAEDVLFERTAEMLAWHLSEDYGTDIMETVFERLKEMYPDQVDTLNKILEKEYARRSWLFEGIIPEDTGSEAEDLAEEIAEEASGALAETPIEIPVTFDRESLDRAISAVRAFYADGVLNAGEINKLKANLGEELLYAALQELRIELPTTEDPHGPTARTAMAVFASAGTGDVRYSPYTGGRADATTTEDRMVAGVTAGVKSANESQNALLQDMVRILTRIAGKDFSVNIVPSSSYGMLTNKSMEQFERVTG